MTTAVASAGKKTIRDLISSDQFKEQVSLALPKHLTSDRFIRVALTTVNKTPKLAQCDQTSLFGCLLTLSQLGLEPDGRHAHIIPYGNTATLIIDYKGLVDLVMRTGNVSKIHADVVCDRDEFEYDRGEIKSHKIDFRNPRGDVYAAYAMCRFKDGTEAVAVLTKDEVESVRKRSRAGTSGPWVTDWNEMAKKTCFRRLSKWLPLSSEFRDALEKDADAIENGHNSVVSPKPIQREGGIVLDVEATDITPDAEPEADSADKSQPKPVVERDPDHEILLAALRRRHKDKRISFKKACETLEVPYESWEESEVGVLQQLEEMVPGNL